MAQLSRPYQIALGATVFLALVWFVALRGHSASSTTPVASAPAPAVRSSTAAPSAAATSQSAAHAKATPHAVTSHAGLSATGRPPVAAHSGIPAKQAVVESELKQGKIVLVLFWNPQGADDVAVRRELRTVAKQLGGKIAVHDALAGQVGSFGSITRAIQVYQTPTILFVNGKGLTTTLTGFTDAFSIEQTIAEARQA